MADPDDELSFHYIKSPNCSEVVVHGAFGGINRATGQLHMAIFAERPPIPQVINVTADEEGKAAAALSGLTTRKPLGWLN
ncbi:MAG TPA: hypothetical protein VMM55_13855 [Thermohalobaculum sp.]|nr:hypothetical protein [Thermohalobaculum sp.]